MFSRHKSEMPTAESALPGRETRPFVVPDRHFVLGTPLEPDFAGVDLLVEEVSEQLYRIDRTMFHVSSSSNVRRAARLRLGRVGDILENDPEFGSGEQAIVEDWCRRSGINFGGLADIGHDADNKVVPFRAENR